MYLCTLCVEFSLWKSSFSCEHMGSEDETWITKFGGKGLAYYDMWEITPSQGYSHHQIFNL